MDASKNRVFYYHADAAPIGGHFTKPKETILHSHGSSSLAQAGGHVTASAESMNTPDKLVSFKKAYSEIEGKVSKTGSWTTLVTSVIEGLNVWTWSKRIGSLQPFQSSIPAMEVIPRPP